MDIKTKKLLIEDHSPPKTLTTTTKSIKETLEARELVRRRDQRNYLARENQRLALLRDLGSVVREEIVPKVVEDYIKGSTISQLSEQYCYSETKIRDMIEEYHQALSNSRAIHALPITRSDGFNPVIEKLKKIEVINDEFLNKLSPLDSETLTEEEALYAWMYVHRGDAQEAMEMSNLDAGLFKDAVVTYKRGIFARSLFLSNKDNIAKYIKELREQRYIREDISKTYIQSLLLEQIEQVKSKGDRKDSVHLRQLIELLGKTIGAFTDKIEIMEVNPSKSLDLLIEMAKEATVRELPESSTTTQ